MPSAADYAKTAGNMTMFALQIASVAPVPGLDTVLTVLEGIKSACSEGPVHKEKFKDIGRTVDQLRGPLEEHYNRKKNESLDETVDYILGYVYA
ncbi:hypothetical protein BC629DRAFT_1473652 [Irpex lacteus]|nr:hypothetical protein BC629DRAFT_1473652 [Irpex lacteus]